MSYLQPKIALNVDTSSFNYEMARDHGHSTLKKFLADLRSRNFDSIKFATYRTAAKLFYIQTSTNLHLVDLYNIIEAFRENGLNTVPHNTELDEARLEYVIASIFYALDKRLPSSNHIAIESNIVSLTQWIMHVYDKSNLGRISILSIKTALTMLCSGRLIDKLRYVFTQVSESDGLLNMSKFGSYLKELLALPAAVGEEPSFSYGPETLKELCVPIGIIDSNNTNLDRFLQALMIENSSGSLLWLHVLHKLIRSSIVEHDIQCKACGRKPFNGLRYKCVDCYNYQVCQDCFWREKTSGSHTSSHDVREYCTWNKGEKGTSVRKKFLCSPSARDHRLPDYPREPEASKTLDMSNIVPAVPSDMLAPASPVSPLFTNHSTPNNTMNYNGAKEEGSKAMSQESVGRMDDEHRLIVRYAQRLASESGSDAGSSIVDNSFVGEISKEQRAMISTLEDQNRSLLREIRKLKAEHDQTIKNAQQVGTDPNVLTELKVLRQRKDELEMRMSALQETRRELMVQLEGLMKLLKSGEPEGGE